MAIYPRLNATRLVTGLLVLSAAYSMQPVLACLTAFPKNARVEVVDESAVIVWDATTHQEKFIRRASFNATSKDFGFLVPTPSVPQLTEVNNSAFDYLEREIRPRTVPDNLYGLTFSSLLFPNPQAGRSLGVKDMQSVASLSMRSVQVLDRQRVAGYDAVVLSAESAGALGKWLQSHGYVARPALLAWLTPYVQAHWKITAFKIANDTRDGDKVTTLNYVGQRADLPIRMPEAHTITIPRATSYAVQMSFTTARPFFPYREPADQRAPGHYATNRSLRVFLLSSARMDGTLGEAAGAAPWPGKVFAASPIADAKRDALASSLSRSADPLPANLWLTTFVDRSSPRPGTDEVYVAPAARQTPVVPPVVVLPRVQNIDIPIEPLAILGGLGLFYWRKRRREKMFAASLQPSR